MAPTAPTASKQKAEGNTSKRYTVVKFENDTVEFVPTKWIVAGRLCLWPKNTPNSRIAVMVKERWDPEVDWDLCSCVRMASFNSYKRAKKNARDAEYTSHLESDSSEGEDNGAGTDILKPTGELQRAMKRITLPSPPSDIGSAPHSPAGSAEPSPPASSGSRGYGFSSSQCSASAESENGSRVSTEGAEVGLTAYEKKTLKMQVEIKAALRDISSRMAVLEARCGSAPLGEPSDVLEEFLQEPLSNMQEWEALEEQLQDCPARKNLVDRIAVLGGGSLNDAVRLVMEACTRKALQKQITVEGRNGKKAFKGTRLFSCVLSAVHKRMDILKIPVTDKEVIARISRYLACAGDCEGGRKERSSKQ
ncbi:uncharacterized protein LOC135374073 [Ornithodoros turicata]|uniref:uncharacterized protein LOC135374073 n=1 Tax=Ornithodoros turicata TaxID=34597 RepID=UPI003139ABFB